MRKRNAQKTFVLVHGSWRGAWCWDRVRDRLQSLGHCVLTPALPGRGPLTEDRSAIGHDDNVAAVLTALDGAGDEPVVLVGHSLGGVTISQVADRRPQRVGSLVYCAAFVLEDGQSAAGTMPETAQAAFAELAAARPDGAIALPWSLWRTNFIQTADEHLARASFARLVPDPHRPVFEPIRLRHPVHRELPTSIIALREDLTMPPGFWHPAMTDKRGGTPIVEIDGDHEAMLSAPTRLADALHHAARRDAVPFSTGGGVSAPPHPLTRGTDDVVTFDIDLARTALLIVDLQRCFVDDSPVAAPDGPAVVRRLNELAAVCRQRGVRVIHTRHVVRPDHSNAGLLAEIIPAVAHGVIDDGSPMSELHPGLVVASGDIVVAKPRFGAFHGTDVETILRAAHIDTLIIGGIATNMCVETTAREAAVREFRVLFLRDGTATFALPDAGLGPASAEEVQRVTCATMAFGFGEVLDVYEAVERLVSAGHVTVARKLAG